MKVYWLSTSKLKLEVEKCVGSNCRSLITLFLCIFVIIGRIHKHRDESNYKIKGLTKCECSGEIPLIAVAFWHLSKWFVFQYISYDRRSGLYGNHTMLPFFRYRPPPPTYLGFFSMNIHFYAKLKGWYREMH